LTQGREGLGGLLALRLQDEFGAELPADTDGNDATGGVFGADLDGSLTMRDVILVKKGGKVKASKPDSGNFDTRYEPEVGGIMIPVDRGWTSVEAKVKGNKRTKGAKFRFVNTHLEAFSSDLALAQAVQVACAEQETGRDTFEYCFPENRDQPLAAGDFRARPRQRA